MPPLHPVEQALTDLCQSYPELRWELREEEWYIGRQEGPPEIRIEQEPERYSLHTPEWHGHYQELEDLIIDLDGLLDGSLIIVQLFRNGERAAAWVEETDEPGKDYWNTVLYFSPYDPREWEAQPLRIWKEVRTVRRLTGPDPFPTRSEEVILEGAAPARMVQQDRVVNTFGPAPAGTRWLVQQPEGCLVPMPWAFQTQSGTDEDGEYQARYQDDQGATLWVQAYVHPDTLDAPQPDDLTWSSTSTLVTSEIGSFDRIEEDPEWERLVAQAEHVWGERRILLHFTLVKPVKVSPETYEALMTTLVASTKLTCW